MIKSWLLWLLVEDVTAGVVDWKAPVRVPPELAALGDGVLRLLPLPVTWRVCDVAVLMCALSDNTATNVVIKVLGGPDAINARLAELDDEARLRGWFSARGARAAGADTWEADPDTPSTTGISVCSAGGHDALVRRARDVGGSAYELFEQVLSTQQDRRSLARYVLPDVTFAHKTGTVFGVRHDAGWLDLAGGGSLDMSAFTDGPYREESVDDPACVGMGRAAAWTLRLAGADDALVEGAPALPEVVLVPLPVVGMAGIDEVLRSPDVLRSLRSLDAERGFWAESLAAPRPAAWGLAGGSGDVLGLACLYGGPEDPAVGIYLADPGQRSRGLGTRGVALLVGAARARGAAALHWTAAADNAASLALAARSGFRHRETAVGFRTRDGQPVDEQRLVLPL